MSIGVQFPSDMRWQVISFSARLDPSHASLLVPLSGSSCVHAYAWVLCLLPQMGACLPVYPLAWTPEPAQLSACRGPRFRGNSQAASETTVGSLTKTGLSC